MRAIRLSRFGAPSEVLQLEDVPAPAPGPGEVRVRFTHRPINPSDLFAVAGLYPVRPALPGSPGLEGVGRIDALGEGVTSAAVGQRVISVAGAPGTWAEQMVLPAAGVLPVPEAVRDQAAAQTLVNPVTVWAMLVDDLAVREGEWLLQTAAGSTLGRLVIQLARMRGVRTLNVVRRRAQADELLALGGDAAVATDEESLPERVRAITGGAGVRAAIDAVGGETGAAAAACLAPGGTLLAMGLMSGDPRMPIDVGDLLFKSATVRGFWLTNWFAAHPPAHVAAAISEVLALLATGRLDPPVEAEYDLADFKAALAHAERPGRSGKVLLVG